MMKANQLTTTARLEARISKELHGLLKHAADLQHITMTDFIITAVQAAAEKAIEQTDIIRLSLADQSNFAKALLSPPKPNSALRRAFNRHDNLIEP
jgi:uncharacterized protein (DUF1778 family)